MILEILTAKKLNIYPCKMKLFHQGIEFLEFKINKNEYAHQKGILLRENVWQTKK